MYGERDISTLLLSKLINGLIFYFLKYSSKYTTRSKIGGWGNLEQCLLKLLKSAICIVKDLCTANVDEDEYRVATKPLLVPLATRFCTKLILAKFSELILRLESVNHSKFSAKLELGAQELACRYCYSCSQ